MHSGAGFWRYEMALMARLSVGGGPVLKRHRALLDDGPKRAALVALLSNVLQFAAQFQAIRDHLTCVFDGAMGVPRAVGDRLLGYPYRTQPGARRVPEVKLVKAGELARLGALPIGHVAADAGQLLRPLRC